MGYIASIDQGTTSTRCVIVDKQGAIVASSQVEHTQFHPQQGWVEHDAAEIWTNTEAVIAGALAQGGFTKDDIDAIGITNQRETTVLWDRATGEPVAPAIVWQDTRTAAMVAAMADQTDAIRATTGLPPATYFSGPKVRWLLDNTPGLQDRAAAGEIAFGTMDSWLIFKLTGRHVTDVTNASRTMLVDLATGEWDDAMCELIGVPKDVLPEIVPSVGVVAAARGDLAGVPVAGILGDQQAALFGQGGISQGDAKNTYGTGCFLLVNTGLKPVQSNAGLLTTIAYQIGSGRLHYALEGSVAVAGSAVQWLRDNMGMIETSPEIESLASEVEDNGGVYFVPAFSGLFAPRWRPDARGVIAGLTHYATKAHLARAVLEATAFQTAEVLEAVEQDTGIRMTELRVDGGMAANNLLMQFQADILDMPVVVPENLETTAMGAAFAAGLAVGYWRGPDDIRDLSVEDRRFEPNMSEERRAETRHGWEKAVTRSLSWVDEPPST
ncbi:Glycerol kinase [hydrothermal vent metagenome]|uniref:glycerol kinase n=1 Tax=hydrothermal vent metagenome TaxID=652676 RepID=A0A3B0SV07_9ZZZZ